MELAVNIAQIVAAVLAGLSITGAYALYRIGHRDRAMAVFKADIARLRADFHAIQDTIGGDFADEIVNAVVRSEHMQSFFRHVYDSDFVSGQSDDISEAVRKHLSYVPTALRSPLLAEFRKAVSSLAGTAGIYSTEFPLLVRFVVIAKRFLNNFYDELFKDATSVDIWQIIVTGLYAKRTSIPTCDALVRDSFMLCAVRVQDQVNTVAKPAVLQLVHIVDVLADHYLACTSKELERLSKAEMATKIRPFSEVSVLTDSLDGLLTDAKQLHKKGFMPVLDHHFGELKHALVGSTGTE